MFSVGIVEVYLSMRNNKTNDMDMTTRVNKIAADAIKNLKSMCDSIECDPCIDLFECAVSVALSGYSCENESAHIMMTGFVKKAIKRLDSKLYDTVYNIMRLDQNGNYTSNPNLWA